MKRKPIWQTATPELYRYHPAVDPEIYKLMYRLGVTPNYTGFHQTAYALHLVGQEPGRLQFVTKWLYPDVAKVYHTHWMSVERNIRQVRTYIWQNNSPLLQTIALQPMDKPPSASQFLAMMSAEMKFHLSEEAPVKPAKESKE